MRLIARSVLFALAVGVGGAGCAGTVRGTAMVSAPQLVLIQGDVWVVERYQEPVFYTERYYWRWYGNVWYRSTVHTGGWVQVSVTEVPGSIQQIPQPDRYANYVAPSTATKRTGPPDHAPAHGVRGTQPGHDAGGPHGHGGGPPAGAGGPPMKDDKGPPAGAGGPHGHGGGPPAGAGGPPMKDDKGPPPGAGGPPMKEDKGKPAGGPGAPAKDAKPADKGPPPKQDKPAGPGGGDKPAGKGNDEKKGGKK